MPKYDLALTSARAGEHGASTDGTDRGHRVQQRLAQLWLGVGPRAGPSSALPAPVRGPAPIGNGRVAVGAETTEGEGRGQAVAGAGWGHARGPRGVRGRGARGGERGVGGRQTVAPQGCEGAEGWGARREDDDRGVRGGPAGRHAVPHRAVLGREPHRRVPVSRGHRDGHVARGGPPGALAPRHPQRPGGIRRQAGHPAVGRDGWNRRGGYGPLPARHTDARAGVRLGRGGGPWGGHKRPAQDRPVLRTEEKGAPVRKTTARRHRRGRLVVTVG